MPDQVAFNLVDDPWIAVVDDQGRTSEVSLTDLFVRAQRLRQIAGEAVTQDFALLRLCLAVLTRALAEHGPRSAGEVAARIEMLAATWADGVVPLVTDYLDLHRDRFDLFHPTQPFFQVAGMHTAKGGVSELSKIIVDMPAGRPYLAMRSARAARTVLPAEAARWLVHTQAFDPSGIKTGVVGHPRATNGKVYPEPVAWTGQLGALHLVGESLLHTLLLNLWAVLPSWEERDADLPAWERPPSGLDRAPDLSSRPAGPVDLYTWQPRRVLLVGNRAGVTGALVTYGDTFTVQDKQLVTRYEPMSLWRYSEPQSRKYKVPIQMPSSHRPGVALWRGLANVLPRAQRRDDGTDPAPTQIVEHAARLGRSTLLPDGLVRYRAIGVEYGSQNSVIDEVVEDSLDLPAAVLDPDDAELRHVALAAVGAAKEGVAALARLARGLARAAGAGTEESKGPGDRAYEVAFAALDSPYRTWLRTTLAGAAADPLRAEAQWHVTARRVLDRLGEGLTTQVPDKAWTGFGATGKRDDVGAVYERFRRDLGRAFPRARVPVQPDEPDPTEPTSSGASTGRAPHYEMAPHEQAAGHDEEETRD